MGVVNDLVLDVDRRPEPAQRDLDDVDRANDAGTEPTRGAQIYVQGCPPAIPIIPAVDTTPYFASGASRRDTVRALLISNSGTRKKAAATARIIAR